MEEGRAVCQMSILLHKPYGKNGPQRGRCVKNIQNTVHMVYGWPHTATIRTLNVVTFDFGSFLKQNQMISGLAF